MVGNIAQLCVLVGLMSTLTACGGSHVPTAPSSAPSPAPAATTGVVQGVVMHEGYVSHGSFPQGPVTGAPVMVTEGPGAGQTVTTGADGAYRFELPPGPFRVRWSWPGNESRDSDPGTVAAGTTVTLDSVVLRLSWHLPIPEWSVSGTIRDSAGNPIADASIIVEDFVELYGNTSTDTSGRYRFASTHQHANLRVTAAKNGYTSPEGYGVGELLGVVCAPSCEKVDIRLLRVVRGTLDGPSAMRVGDVAPLSVITDYEDGSRRVFTSFSIPVSSNLAVVRVVPPTKDPYQIYAAAIAPGS